MATISEFTTDIQHMSGKDNIVADTLSHLPPHENNSSFTQESRDEEVEIALGFMFDSINMVQPGLDCQAMASAQTDDPDVQAYRTTITSLRLEDVPFSNGTFTSLCNVSTGIPRPVVPEAWRRSVFHTVHSLSHPGARTTKWLVSRKFVWHSLG